MVTALQSVRASDIYSPPQRVINTESLDSLPKSDNPVIIYSPSGCFKPVLKFFWIAKTHFHL